MQSRTTFTQLLELAAATLFLMAPTMNPSERAGTVTGRIFERDSRQGIANCTLRINEAETQSDQFGNFKFSFLRAGSYFIDIDSSTLPANLVPQHMLPRTIEIAPGANLQIDVPLTHSANLTGKILVYRLEDEVGNEDNVADKNHTPQLFAKASKSSPLRTHGLSQALVELSNGRQVRRRVSDGSGRFDFRDLPFGKWKLSLSEYYLPTDHYLAEQSADIDLPAGTAKDVLVSIFPNRKNFQILEESLTHLEQSVPAATMPIRVQQTDSTGYQVYTVKKGDWLSMIARKFYGDAMLFPLIFERNSDVIFDPDLIFPGQEIKLPTLEQKMESYTVKPGDWLSKIAIAFTGDADFREIYEANKESIADPDLIFPGQNLLIPRFSMESASTTSKSEARDLHRVDELTSADADRSRDGSRRLHDEPKKRAQSRQ